MGDADEAEEDGKTSRCAPLKAIGVPVGRSNASFTVLLVEDDRITCKLVATSLKACCYDGEPFDSIE